MIKIYVIITVVLLATLNACKKPSSPIPLGTYQSSDQGEIDIFARRIDFRLKGLVKKTSPFVVTDGEILLTMPSNEYSKGRVGSFRWYWNAPDIIREDFEGNKVTFTKK